MVVEAGRVGGGVVPKEVVRVVDSVSPHTQHQQVAIIQVAKRETQSNQRTDPMDMTRNPENLSSIFVGNRAGSVVLDAVLMPKGVMRVVATEDAPT